MVTQLLADGHASWESDDDAASFKADPLGTVGSTAGRLHLTWRSAASVAVELWEHVRTNGMFGNVLTVYELHSGDVAPGTPFHNMDPWLVREAIRKLEEQEKAALFPGSTIDEEGVKFASE